MFSVSIVIINYKCASLAVDCITSIFNNEKKIPFEIIVVDNNSDDDIENILQKNFPLVEFVQTGFNAGFSKANNLGTKIAKGDYILFLNPDTRFIEPVLEKCISEFERNDKIGVLGCRLLNTDSSLQLSYHDGHQVFKKLWWRNPLVIKFLNGTHKARKSMDLIKEKHQSAHAVDWLCGAFVMMRKADIEKYELYWDENFFMYWEDVELGVRVRKKGMRNIYFPKASIIHIGGGGENVSLSRFAMMEQSKLIFIRKINGVTVQWIYKLLFRMQLWIEWHLNKKSNTYVPVSSYFKNELDFYNVKAYK